MKPLEGMNAMVTGAAGGIGIAIAEALVRAGARVCITGRHAGRLRAAKDHLLSLGGEVSTEVFDVADREACCDAVSSLAARWGSLDALVNNAGIYKAGSFMETASEDFEALFRANVVGCIQLMQAALPQMIQRGRGRIVNIASTAGKWGSLNQSAYNASKHALVGLTRCVALEVARSGVTVNAVCPGLVDTSMAQALLESKARSAGTDARAVREELVTRKIPIGRLIDPSEIGPLVAYLLSPAAGGMTGQSLLYDGGSLQI